MHRLLNKHLLHTFQRELQSLHETLLLQGSWVIYQPSTGFTASLLPAVNYTIALGTKSLLALPEELDLIQLPVDK